MPHWVILPTEWFYCPTESFHSVWVILLTPHRYTRHTHIHATSECLTAHTHEFVFVCRGSFLCGVNTCVVWVLVRRESFCAHYTRMTHTAHLCGVNTYDASILVWRASFYSHHTRMTHTAHLCGVNTCVAYKFVRHTSFYLHHTRMTHSAYLCAVNTCVAWVFVRREWFYSHHTQMTHSTQIWIHTGVAPYPCELILVWRESLLCGANRMPFATQVFTHHVAHIWMSHVTHTWMSHVTQMNESCHTRMNEPCHTYHVTQNTYEWVMSHAFDSTYLNPHIWMSHVKQIFTRRVTHIWMSHVTGHVTYSHLWHDIFHLSHVTRHVTHM